MPTLDLQTHSTHDPYLAQIESVIRRVLRESRLYLFGSRAANTPRVGSDYDIGVRGEPASAPDLSRARELLEESTIPFTVDLVDLGAASLTFVQHIEQGSNNVEKFTDRLASAQRALATLAEILQMPKSVIVRDASIQRFEYTFESLWKLAKAYLEELEGVIANSPKQVFREALKTGLLSAAETETSLKMTDDRNLTAHTYLENIAEDIYGKLPAYLTVMEKLVTNILERTGRTKPGAETPTETAPKAD
jgi:nucleotidyltransferase substrate binding protein (TIGR01987 family)